MINLLLALTIAASHQGIHQGIEADPTTTAVVSWYSDSTDTEVPAVAIDGEWWWETWDRWFSMVESIAIQKPFVCALGNHEYAEAWESEYEWQESTSLRIHQPGNSKYFLLRIPPVAILILDSSRLENRKRVTPYSVKHGEWLKETLEELYTDPEIKWRIAMFHHPVYTSDPSRVGNAIIKNYALPFMEDLDVDIIFNGHHHIYSRSHPIVDDVPYILDSGASTSYFDPPGIIHVVTGGGGRGLGDSVDNPYIAKHDDIHHFMYVKIIDNKMKISAVNKFGVEFDYFEIVKD